MLEGKAIRGGDDVVAAGDWQIDGSIFCDIAVVDDNNPRPKHHRLIDIMGDEKYRLASLAPKIMQHGLQLSPGNIVEGAKWLVGQ